MKPAFRETSPQDLGRLTEFLIQAFDSPRDAPFVNPLMLSWKYWDERDDYGGPRSFVLERDDRIVAHAGLWPMTFGSGENTVRGVHMIDWASAKAAPGAGLAIVQKLAGLFDFIVAIGGADATRKVLPAFGFRECAQQWKGSRPLHPVRQMLSHQRRDWKLVLRLGRNLYRAAGMGKTPPGWQTREIQPHEILPELHSTEAARAGFSPRPPAFFEYLCRCPRAKVTLHGIMYEGNLQGHFALSRVRGQVRVAGVWLRDPRPISLQAAFSLAQQAASKLEGANEIVATGTGNMSGNGAATAGLTLTPSAPVYVLNKQNRIQFSPDFQFQLSDDDEAVLDIGNPNYWS